MTINQFSVLLVSLLLLVPITISGGGKGGGIPNAFGQNIFLNITGTDIIDLADNITDRVQEKVGEEVAEDIINLSRLADEDDTKNNNYGNNNNRIDNNNSSSSGAMLSLPSLITTPTTAPTVVINEVELNPTGEDDEGEEWIELYNPSDANINIGNYEIRTSSGSAAIMLPPDVIVEAGETYVVELEEGEDYLSNIVESLILTTTDTTTTAGDDDDDDNNSIVMDRTPSLVDMSNDERTWQRIPDGYNEWRFVEETEGELNDPDNHSNNNSHIVNQIFDTIEHYYSESDAQCIGYAGCIEGITTRIVDGDTLYITANDNNTSSGNTIYKVDLALIEAPPRMEEGEGEHIDSAAFTRDLCLGSDTLMDQDDKLLTTKSSVDSSSVIAVVYCSSTNLNKELLDLGYAELDMQQCATSEFANESWAKDHGC